jgi:hypothetical protein
MDKFQTGGPDGDLGSNEIKISKDRTTCTPAPQSEKERKRWRERWRLRTLHTLSAQPVDTA